MEKEQLECLITEIIDAAYRVRKILSYGYVEKVYQRSMVVELAERGIRAVMEYPIPVYYKGCQVGDYKCDLLVEDAVLVELKSVDHLSVAHEVQLVNYLTATGINDGLLINFGPDGIKPKRKYRERKI